ncbi:hypothetical protein [Rosettibacter firmus]|uniref:hypothetical protein n=1 Tax=Rosettibacter firmus TaxID=3111522 RepID=UPI00336BB4FA
MKIRISNHAIKAYKNRILLNEAIDEKQIINQIKEIFKQARYISDNKNGILFRDDNLMIEYIVKNKCIVTIYPIRRNSGNNGKNIR